MARKTEYENYRVEVYPTGPVKYDSDTCHEIAKQIRRHVNDAGIISVVFDTTSGETTSGNDKKHSFVDLFAHFCAYASIGPDNCTERELRLAEFAFYCGGNFPPEDYPGWETDDYVHPLCEPDAALGMGA